jgi:hypothetical protein
LDGLRIHDLRHTAVALWIAAGANPKEVAARAGHASVSFTLDRYGHLYSEADLTLRERLEAIWSASGADGDRPRPDRPRPQCSPSGDGAAVRTHQGGATARWLAVLAGGRDRVRTCDLVVVSDAL